MSKISNRIAPIFIFLTIAGYLVLLITSCNNNTGARTRQVTIDIPKDNSGLDSIDHFISATDIEAYRAAFKTQKDSLSRVYPYLLLPGSEAFNKRTLLSLLQAPDCVGLRFYHGVKKGKRDELRLIIVGVDSGGKDILISKESIIAVKITQTTGGAEHGQCSDCQE